MNKDLTTGNLVKILPAFTLPLILSGMLQQMFSWVDAFIVGNFAGESALAGIGSTNSVYNLFIMVIVGFAGGLSVLIGQNYGRGDHDAIRSLMAAFSFLFACVMLVIGFTGFLLMDPLLLLMDTPREILPDAAGYLSAVLAAVPFLAVYNIVSVTLRGIGNSKAPFYAIMVSSACNVVLDLLFVAGLNMGAFGAGLATAMAQIAMTIYTVVYAGVKYPFLRIRIADFPEYLKSLGAGARFGMPPAIQNTVRSVGNVLLQRFLNGFGPSAVAAITTAYRVDTVLMLPITNLGTGISTVVAQNVGAGKLDRTHKALQVGSIMMICMAILVSVFMVFAGGPLVAIFGLSEESIAIGAMFFRLLAPFYVVFGLGVAIRGYLEGQGDLAFSGILGIASMMVRLGCSYLMKNSLGIRTIVYAEAVSWIFMLAVFGLRYYLFEKKSAAKQ